MSENFARQLWECGRAHGVSAQLLYRAALNEAQVHLPEDPERFAFNGSYSLSIYNLIGLAFELMFKAAFVASGGDGSDQSLKRIGHNLDCCLHEAKEQGFVSHAPNLTEIIRVMGVPYRKHFFRYARPDEFAVPNLQQVFECFAVLDDELREKIGE